ncbi:hypothetical protein, partial [Paramuribaculum intestinale]|uniref:hypothetical protein n=1 Tax=Paramuribaculum intestinale TaxID=2094151 RepID=UPI00272D3752
LLPESECKVTPKNLPHQIFRKENYTTKTNFFNKPLQFSTISHQKKISKKTPQALSIRFCPPDTDISPQNS